MNYSNKLSNRQIKEFSNSYIVFDEKNFQQELDQAQFDCLNLENNLIIEEDFEKSIFLQCLLLDAKNHYEFLSKKFSETIGNARLGKKVNYPTYCNNPDAKRLSKSYSNKDKILKLHREQINISKQDNSFRYNKFTLQNVVREIMPLSATAKCLRVKHGGEIKDIHLYKHNSKDRKTSKSNFAGLQSCNSAWNCPCCAERIASLRKNEVVKYMQIHREQQGYVYLTTFTFPHSYQDRLNDLSKKLSEAENHFKSGENYTKFEKKWLVDGTIRNCEAKFGANGWHPHLHSLYFLSSKLSKEKLEEFKAELYKLWSNACIKAGLSKPSFENGVDVQLGNEATNYITKYGLENEITGWQAKIGDKSISPFDFLRMLCSLDKTIEQHPEKSKESLEMIELIKPLWLEYTEAFKGKKQLVISRKLEQKYGKEVKTRLDDDEAKKNEKWEAPILLKKINYDEWKTLTYASLRCALLTLAKDCQGETEKECIEEFEKLYQELLKEAKRYKNKGNDRALRPIICI